MSTKILHKDSAWCYNAFMVKPVTVRLDDKTWKRFKTAAANCGIVLGAALTQALVRGAQDMESKLVREKNIRIAEAQDRMAE